MGEFAVALIIPALVYVGVTLLKAVVARNWLTVVWVLGGWAIGFVALLLASASDWGDQIKIGDTALQNLGIVSLIIGGLFAGALASVGFDILGAIRNVGQNQLSSEEREIQTALMSRAANAPLTHDDDATKVDTSGFHFDR